jgi:redox-sensitive bicupin YhaK (pirin superfamily)
MIVVRKAGDRGRFDFGWLDTRHTFSFADYHDPDHMGFRQLRVINEDRVTPGSGFPTHSHRDMEILSYVLEGALEHQDSMGHRETLRPGEVQRMTAGRGVTHSEYNPSRDQPLHFLQIWIMPGRRGLEPGYEQKVFPADERNGKLRLVASPDGRDGSLTINQDVGVHATLLDAGQEVVHRLAPGRHAWIQVARGALEANGQRLEAGDGAAVSGEDAVRLKADSPAEALLFDLA